MDNSSSLSCQHGKTHEETIFVDLESDNSMSYDVMEICDNCGESWCIGEKSDSGEILGKQFWNSYSKQMGDSV